MATILIMWILSCKSAHSKGQMAVRLQYFSRRRAQIWVKCVTFSSRNECSSCPTYLCLNPSFLLRARRTWPCWWQHSRKRWVHLDGLRVCVVSRATCCCRCVKSVVMCRNSHGLIKFERQAMCCPKKRQGSIVDWK